MKTDNTAAWLVAVLVSLVVFLSVCLWTVVSVVMPEQRSRAYLQGLNDGSHNYHSRCANIGGVMVDEGTLIAVHCRGLGTIDGKEIKKWLHS